MSITLVTSTKYDLLSDVSKTRAKLALRTITQAIDFGFEVIVVDSGSSKKFKSKLDATGALVEHKKNLSMGAARRAGFLLASKKRSEIVTWLEPEKTSFVSQILNTAKPILKGSADIVIPARKSLDSYPDFQHLEEYTGNMFWADLTGMKLDIWFGPKTIHRSSLKYFTRYKGKYGDKWESLVIPVIDAYFDGKRIASVTVNYTHSKQETNLEQGNIKSNVKRIEQLTLLTTSMYKHWKKKSPKTI